MVPDNWTPTEIGEIATFSSGGTPPKSNAELWGDSHAWISGKDLKQHYLTTSIDRLSDAGFSIAKVAPQGASLILVRGMTLLKDFPVGFATKPLAFNQDVKALVPKKGNDGLYLSFLLAGNRNRIRQLVSTAGHGTGRLDTQSLKDFPINMPPAGEQKKIAQILSTWDKAITTTEQLLANSQQQKKALMQQLLTGRRRLPGFSEEWQPKPLAHFFKESREIGTTGESARKLTVKLYGRGVVAKDEKRVGSASTRYYKRKSGQFIYSKLDFLNGAFGVIPTELDAYESTLDLPAFDFLPNVCHAWLLATISRPDFYVANVGLANGGRKARRVNPKDFLRIKVATPSKEEQQAIATVLSTASREVEVLASELEALRNEKKALMQQLLTGKRRVTIEEAAA